MRLTRRRFLTYGATVAYTAVHPLMVLSATKDESDWKATCKQWMQVLLPADEHGPGADTPAVWERLLQLMKGDADVRRWLMLGFTQLERQGVPETKAQLDALFERGSPLAKFLGFFQRILLENYYGSEPGWRDLGFSEPPQPKGFLIKT